VRVQSPIRLGERSEPQPDLALLRRRADFYRAGHPGSADTLLVVEVVDTCGAYDREVKLPPYARHGIPQTWLVDLTGNVIEVYRDPRPTGYAV
jgi:Uma2 family endonuclease